MGIYIVITLKKHTYIVTMFVSIVCEIVFGVYSFAANIVLSAVFFRSGRNNIDHICNSGVVK